MTQPFAAIIALPQNACREGIHIELAEEALVASSSQSRANIGKVGTNID
jgi:hypothetical protein